MKRPFTVGVFVVLIGLWSGFSPTGIISLSQAETTKPSNAIKTDYQYAAKVACSILLPQQDSSLAKGTYRTIVNIHNPTNKKVKIAAKVALATQLNSEPGPFDVTPFKVIVLQPDGAVGINCFDITSYFCPINGICVDFAFLEGFLVIKSPVSLDVVSVYTARHSKEEVESIDVETVHPRKIHGYVELEPTEAEKPGEEKRMEYPPKGSPAYNGQKPKQMCGGIAGFTCPEGEKCVDYPLDDCDPAQGDADCPGICVK